MARDLSSTGVVRINDQWATTVRYEIELQNGRAAVVHLRFLQGRQEVERTTALPGDLEALLGKVNAAAIDKAAAGARPEETTVRGELRSAKLAYHEGYLPDFQRPEAENLIERVPVRDREAPANPAASEGNPAGAEEDRLEETHAAVEQREGEATKIQPLEDAAKKDERSKHVPDHIAAKYLHADDHYYFNDKTLAFIDHGEKLRARTENASVVRDLVAIGRARGWVAISIRGTETFRRAVWHEAFVEGMEVSGYWPTQVDIAAAMKERERRTGSQQYTTGEVPPQPSDPKARARSAESIATPGVVPGILRAHGRAPYKFDPKNEHSYYVTIALASGRERTFWGVDLAEAFAHSHTAPALGDRVGVLNAGRQAVKIPKHGRDEDGRERVEWVEAHRNRWVVEKIAYFEDPQRVTRNLAERDDARGRQPDAPAPIERDGADARPRPARVTEADAHNRLADAMVAAGLVPVEDREHLLDLLRRESEARRQRGETLPELDAERVGGAVERTVAKARRNHQARLERSAHVARVPAAPAADVQVRA